MSPLKRTLSLTTSKLTLEKGQVARSPDESGDSHIFEGVVGRMNADQRPEWITEGCNRVQTRWSHELNGEHGMYKVRKHVSK